MCTKNEIYIVHVGGYIGSYRATDEKIQYESGTKFVEFCKKLIKENPNFKIRCIINYGIEQKVIKFINYDKLRKFNQKGREK